MARFSLQPFGGATLTHLTLPAFVEQSTTASGGAGTLSLRYGRRNFTDVKSFAGLAVNHLSDVGIGSTLLLTAKARWEHDFEPERTVPVALASAPGFTVDAVGASGVKDAASFDLRATLRLSGVDITAGARQTTGAHYHNTGGDVGVRFRF